MTDAAEQEFLALLEAHRGIIGKVAATYARDHADREDLGQEIVSQLWRAFPGWDRGRRFSTWMYRIALNTAISWLRSESRRARRFVPADDSVHEIAAGEPEDADERLAVLQRLVASLSDADRALVLLYLDGNAYDVIADVLGISESNVATRMHRIKARLRARR